MKIQASIICANDSIELVLIDENEKTILELLENMAQAHYNKYGIYKFDTYDEYRTYVFWHVKEVEIYENTSK